MSHSNAQARISHLRRGWTAGVCAALLLVAGACNQVSFLVPAPAPRGVTIPLPPPSLTAEPVVEVDIEGELANGAMDDGVRVSLYEQETDLGYFTYTVGGGWLIPDVLVDTTNNCLSVWTTNDSEGHESVREYFKLQQRTGDECVPGCSEADQDGVCICIETWSTGC